MIDYSAVLSALYPGAEWSLSGDSYDGLVWHSDSEMPSQEMLDGAWPQVEYDRAYAAVEQERHAAYVSDADPLFFKWQRGSGSEQAWRDAVQGVKDSNPYPVPPAE